MVSLKVPINVNYRHNYRAIFQTMIDLGFSAVPYLSSSKYGLRRDQNNLENFMWYVREFEDYPRPSIKEIQLVLNTRNESADVKVEINSTLSYLREYNVSLPYRLILNAPNIIDAYSRDNYPVAISSASVSSFKRVIEVLTNDFQMPELSNIEYILPSTINHLIPILPPNSFTVMINNGCRIGCIHAATSADHSLHCPNQTAQIYTDRRKDTDIITKEEFSDLIKKGWTSFKISGRQAPPQLIEEVIKYYLNIGSESLPYIDSHLFYGESSNG